MNIYNGYRESVGMQKVVGEKLLTQLAQAQAEKMAITHATTEDEMHVGFADRELQANAKRFAECTGVGFQTMESQFLAYYNSVDHNPIINYGLWTNIGIGIAYDETGKEYQCVEFAEY